MLSEPGASRSGNSGLAVLSTKRRYLKLVIGRVHLWKQRQGVRLCGLVRPAEETGPLLYLVKSYGGFTGLRRDYRYHRTWNRARLSQRFAANGGLPQLLMLVRAFLRTGFSLLPEACARVTAVQTVARRRRARPPAPAVVPRTLLGAIRDARGV